MNAPNLANNFRRDLSGGGAGILPVTNLLRVLIVEDSEADTDPLVSELRRGGFQPVFQRVESADAMREALQRNTWDLVVSDHSAPQFDSMAALRILQSTGLDVPFIIVSGTIDEGLAVQAMKAGASEYLVKGKLAHLTPAISRELGEARERRARRDTERMCREREQRTARQLSAAFEETLVGWTRALDLQDKETEGHCRRVADLTLQLARKVGFLETECVHIRRGALLHDIGKMAIPDHILHKPAPLTEDEWAIMRRHPAYAWELLSPIDYLQPAIDIPYCHHERWDGRGYPRGLRGDEIPLAARLFAPADIWDAVRSDRPYRSAWSASDARAYIASLAGTHLDPIITVSFLDLIDSLPAAAL